MPAPHAIDQLRALAVFARTVEQGSFRAAAAALGLSPSVVSHHISNLEEALGTALLHRTTRRLALTEEGRALHLAAQEMLAAAERGIDQVAAQAGSPMGRLRVTAPAGLVHDEVFARLCAFAAAFPKVELALHLADQQLDLLGEGIDVAIRAGAMKDSGLRSRRIGELARKLVAAPAYAATRPPPRHPRELATWDWIHLRSRPPVAAFAQRGVQVAFSSRLSVDSVAGAMALARAGLGLATVPAAMADLDLRAGLLREMLPDFPLESPPIYAVWPSSTTRASLTQRLVSFLSSRVERDVVSSSRE